MSNSDPHNVSEIMNAIQRVLEEHDVGQARVVLELFDEADHAISTAAPPQEHVYFHLEGVEGDGPMTSPAPQAPPPRPRSKLATPTFSPRLGGYARQASSAVTGSDNGLLSDDVRELDSTARPTNEGTTNTTTMMFTTGMTGTKVAPVTTTSTKAATPTKAAAPTDAATPTSRVLTPTPPRVPTQTSSTTATSDEHRRYLSQLNVTPDFNTPPRELSAEAVVGKMALDGAVNPATMLPEELFRSLAQQQNRADRIRILKGFVGKSVLLDSKKMREQTAANPPAKQLMGQPEAPKVPDLPKLATTTRTPQLSQNTSTAKPTMPSPPGTKPNLPTLDSRGVPISTRGHVTAAPGGSLPSQNFTETCRDNASRAARLNTGLGQPLVPSSEVSPRSRKDAGIDSKTLPPHPPLQEMLREQQQMELKSKAELLKHKQVMEKARQFLATVGEGRPHTESRLSDQKVDDGPSELQKSRASASPPTTSTRAAAAAPATSSATKKANLPQSSVGHRAATAGCSNNGVAPANGNTHTPLASQVRQRAGNGDSEGRTTALTKTTTCSTPGGLHTPASPVNNSNTTTRTSTTTTKLQSSSPLSTRGCKHSQPTDNDAAAPALTQQTANPVSAYSSIQVVRLTMPPQEEAKQEVVDQLAGSPAGQQHLSSKQRYAALLARQSKVLHDVKESDKEYQKLVERAVEFNKSLQS